MLIAICTLTPSAACLADGFTLNAGADYSSGKYGTGRTTNVVYLPFSAKYETGSFTYALTVPWISVTGSGDIVPGGLGGAGSGIGGIGSDISGGSGGTAGAFGCAADNRGGASKPEDNGPCASTGGTTTGGGGAAATTRRRTTESGIGDVIAAVTYTAIDNEALGLTLDLTGKIKLPTASESRGLGSGKTDYALQINAEKSFGNPSIFFGLGYKWLGDPKGSHLDNVTYASLGGEYKFSQETNAGISFDWATAASSGAPAAKEISVYASHWLNSNVKLNGAVYAGLSDSSPDAGAGLSLSYAF